jgi:hypothetical protein
LQQLLTAAFFSAGYNTAQQNKRLYFIFVLYRHNFFIYNRLNTPFIFALAPHLLVYPAAPYILNTSEAYVKHTNTGKYNIIENFKKKLYFLFAIK